MLITERSAESRAGDVLLVAFVVLLPWSVLCADLARFVFLLGGDDGELLFDGKSTT